MGLERKLIALTLICSLPPTLLLLITLYNSDVSRYLIAFCAILFFGLITYCTTTINNSVNFRFKTLLNLLEAMVQGDYSLRARSDKGGSDFGQLVKQINALADTLLAQKFKAEESHQLLTKIIDHIDVGILAIDSRGILSLINPAGADLYGQPPEALQGQPFNQIGGAAVLAAQPGQVAHLSFPKRKGQFRIYREIFREQGKKHRLLFITDVRVILRKQEREAWQNLIRVLSHEINNSLAPISSICATLKKTSARNRLEPRFATALNQGLEVIGDRAQALIRFIQSYRQLTRLPEPNRQWMDTEKLCEGLPSLFNHRQVHLSDQPGAQVYADPVLLEQVLINLCKNADEAMQQCSDPIIIEWRTSDKYLAISVLDTGPGIINPENLFVPFYTTKEQGMGIGLVFCRQVIEAHEGHLYLQNRSNGSGCEATIELPVH